MNDQQFQQAVLDQLSQLNAGQARLEGRMDRLEDVVGGLQGRLEGLEGHFDRLEQVVEKGFTDIQALLTEVFGSPIAEGVELYTDRQIRAHEERFHPDVQVTS